MPWCGRAGKGSTDTRGSGCGGGAVCCHFASPGSKPEKRPGEFEKKEKKKRFSNVQNDFYASVLASQNCRAVGHDTRDTSKYLCTEFCLVRLFYHYSIFKHFLPKLAVQAGGPFAVVLPSFSKTIRRV